MLTFYADAHVPSVLVRGLRHRGVDIITAQSDGRTAELDAALLDRAAALGRVLLTQDRDFVEIVAELVASGGSTPGVVMLPAGSALAIGPILDLLEIVAMAGQPADLANSVQWL